MGFVFVKELAGKVGIVKESEYIEYEKNINLANNVNIYFFNWI